MAEISILLYSAVVLGPVNGFSVVDKSVLVLIDILMLDLLVDCATVLVT